MKKTPGFLWLIVAAFLMNCLGAATALAWPVPDTGQTTCYDNTAVLAPCPTLGQAFYGQDASYTINPMSYTKLDENGDDLPVEEGAWTMVRDNVTGLIWELKQEKDSTPNYDNPHDADNKYLWYDSNPATNGGNAGTQGDGVTTFDTEQFIAALNDANYGGHDDWRLPTIKELASIVNSSIPYPGPTINTTFFPNTNMFWHWSSTTHSIVTDCAWDVYFDEGNDYSHYKDNGGCVRAVRGGQAGSLDHLVINGDGTVTDTDTGLMWDQDTPDNAMTWESALSTFENSTWAGYTDWRLPTIQELRSLVDYSRFNPVINITYFPDTAASCYWSSTTYANGTDVAWGMYFDYGGDYLNFKDGLYYVRAVRGGQAGSLGNLVISSPKQASAWTIGALMPIRWDPSGLGLYVKISLSRQGGLSGTFETITASTLNDGQHDWTVTGPDSVNCVIKIEQADNAANWATEGLFVINKAPVNPAIYLLLLE